VNTIWAHEGMAEEFYEWANEKDVVFQNTQRVRNYNEYGVPAEEIQNPLLPTKHFIVNSRPVNSDKLFYLYTGKMIGIDSKKMRWDMYSWSI
jgi:hypothetical protein